MRSVCRPALSTLSILSTCLALLATTALAGKQDPPQQPAYVPPSAQQVPGYFEGVMPCEISKDEMERSTVNCEGDLLGGKTLRELSLLRNTIFARYGWDGYRKPWVREYFHSQPWFRPNPRFSYKMLSPADKKNAHFIGAREHQFSDTDLKAMRDDIYARHGKIWHDKPEQEGPDGKVVKTCKAPKGVFAGEGEDPAQQSRDCYYAEKGWYHPNPAFREEQVSATERIELGLLSRALGEFAVDDDRRGKSESTLDRVLSANELRALSLRDLRLLRNTIYARRGRPFKSKILRDHFGRMQWYTVNADYSDKLLSKNDVRNIALIRSVEDEFGGPLGDEDWLIEPATDAA